jgi:branched-chain amino acid transport system permease protein
MESSVFLQAALNGLILGSMYVLFALGFSLIFGILDTINFAHGEMYMLGGFGAYYLFGQLGWNYFLTLIVVVFAITLLGMGLEFVVLRPVRGFHIGGFVATLGLGWIFVQSGHLIFGSMDKAVPRVFKGIVTIWGASISVEKLIAGFMGFVLVVLVFLFIGRTRLGKAMRAVTQDRDAAWLQGINVDHINRLGFGIGCGLAAAAGVLMAPVFYIAPDIGGAWLFKGFIVVILGGLGSIPGAVAGGLLVGFLESFASLFISLPAVQILLFSVAILILVFRPRGLLGHA